MTSPDDGRIIEANGISLYVEEHGDGDPVLLLHGWPDSARLWRHQVPVLAASGYRVITPDLRGFGRSEQPAEVRSYGLRNVVGDIRALLDQVGVETAHVVGHDWGSGVAWLTAILHPDRVRTLTVIGGPHPSSPPTLRQYEMAWYTLAARTGTWCRQSLAESGQPCRSRTGTPSPCSSTYREMPFASMIRPSSGLVMPRSWHAGRRRARPAVHRPDRG